MNADLRKIYAPIFEVNLHLRIPAESDSSENSKESFLKSDKCSEKSVRCEEDEMSKSEVSCVVKHTSEELPIMRPKKFRYNLHEFLSGKTTETIKNSGKYPNSWKITRERRCSSLLSVSRL